MDFKRVRGLIYKHREMCDEVTKLQLKKHTQRSVKKLLKGGDLENFRVDLPQEPVTKFLIRKIYE